MGERSGELSAASYARRIERAWSELLARPVVLSPREWSLVCDWHRRGIPLAIVEMAMQEAAEREKGRPSRSKPQSLSYLAPAVEESWSIVLDGRLSADAGPPTEPPAIEDAWRRRIDAEPPRSALRRVLEALLDRRAAGEDPAALDEELDERLPSLVGAEVREEVEAGIERDLSAFRARISTELDEATRRAWRSERLRRRLGLPRIAPAR